MLKVFGNKNGSEMIEAAIVVPLLLLAVISLICFALYCHGEFKSQIEVQQVLLFEDIVRNDVFAVISESALTSKKSEGLFTDFFGREYRQRLYVINEELIIRAREVIGGVNGD